MVSSMRAFIHILIICIIVKMLVLFVAFVHEARVDRDAAGVCRTEHGHRCGCIYVYQGKGKYKLVGSECPKERTSE